jgi:phosphatidylglycerol:prolipoprotein diacylglycerol transferase
MYPTIFNLPIVGWPIYAYGLMMVAAFLACQWLSGRLAKRFGIDPEIFVNATLFALVAGVIGARMSHVLENLHDYTLPTNTAWQNFLNMVNIRSGGLTYYGGVILAAPVVLGYVLWKKVPGRLAADIVAPCLVLGLAIGRIGCFLNGCCYGADTNVAWGMSFPYYSNAYIDQYDHKPWTQPLNHNVPPELTVLNKEGDRRLLAPADFKNDPTLNAIAAKERSNPVHPAQLYSTITGLLIMAVCLAFITMPHAPGRVFALMLLLEGPTRFLLEMLRVEPPVWRGMSLSMIIGALMFAIGVVCWIWFGIVAKHEQTESVPPAARAAIAA